MTDIDITPIKGITTHPYVATIIMDPAMWSRFEWTFDDRPEVKILMVDRQVPEPWTVYVACASDDVRDLLESNW
jgi:hypothetical protein